MIRSSTIWSSHGVHWLSKELIIPIILIIPIFINPNKDICDSFQSSGYEKRNFTGLLNHLFIRRFHSWFMKFYESALDSMSLRKKKRHDQLEMRSPLYSRLILYCIQRAIGNCFDKRDKFEASWDVLRSAVVRKGVFSFSFFARDSLLSLSLSLCLCLLNKRSHELAEGEFRSSDVKLKSLHPASSVAVSERNGPADRFLACNIASLVAKREETNQRTLILLPLSLCLLCHRRRST